MSNEDEQLPYGDIILTEDGQLLVMVGSESNPRAVTMCFDGKKLTAIDEDGVEAAPLSEGEKRICNMEEILREIMKHIEEEYEDNG